MSKELLTYRTFPNAKSFEKWQEDSKDVKITLIQPIAQTVEVKEGLEANGSLGWGLLVIYWKEREEVKS